MITIPNLNEINELLKSVAKYNLYKAIGLTLSPNIAFITYMNSR